MPKNDKHDFPDHLYVNVGDRENGVPIFCASASLEEIPDDQHGELVAVYLLKEVKVLEVKRSLA